jgi:RNA polymerase sigma-70 factor, ECF subfamily
VLTVRDERISEITSFIGAEHFALFGLPTAFP